MYLQMVLKAQSMCCQVGEKYFHKRENAFKSHDEIPDDVELHVLLAPDCTVESCKFEVLWNQ